MSNKVLNYLKKRWGLTSIWQVIVILIVFSLTGFSALYVKNLLYSLAGITTDTHPAIRIPYGILATIIVYQFLLLGYGTLLGQFKFFWAFEKKMLRRFGFFRNEKKPPSS